MEVHENYGKIHNIGCVFYPCFLPVPSPWLVDATRGPPLCFLRLVWTQIKSRQTHVVGLFDSILHWEVNFNTNESSKDTCLYPFFSETNTLSCSLGNLLKSIFCSRSRKRFQKLHAPACRHCRCFCREGLFRAAFGWLTAHCVSLCKAVTHVFFYELDCHDFLIHGFWHESQLLTATKTSHGLSIQGTSVWAERRYWR